MPGAGVFLDPPVASVGVDAITARVDAQEDKAADLERLVLGDLQLRLDALDRQRADLTNLIQGSITSRQDALDQKAGKAAGKVQKALNARLGTAYSYAFPYGAVYPTDDQVVYGLTTGDILGSMGVAGTAVDARASGTAPLPTLPGGAGVPVDSLPGGTRDIPVTTLPAIVPTPPVVPPPYTPPYLPPTTPTTPTLPGGSAPGQPPQVPTGPGAAPSPPGGPPYTPPPYVPPPYVPPPATPPYSPPPGSPGGPGGPPPGPQDCGPYLFWDPVSGQCVSGTYGHQETIAGGGSCPEGYSWVPGQVYGSTDDDASGDGVVRPAAGRPDAGSPCPDGPPITGGWTPTPQLPPVQTSPGQWFMPPWLNGQLPEGLGAQATPIPTCLISNYVGTEPVLTVYVPAGWSLCVPTRGGQVTAATTCPTGYVPVPPPTPGPTVPPGGGGGGGGGGGQCVPQQPTVPAPPCQDLPQPTCGPAFGGSLPALTADTDDVCKAIADAIEKIKGQNAAVTDWLGMKWANEENNSTAAAVIAAITGVGGPLLPGLVGRFARWLQGVIRKANEGLNCNAATLLPIIINRGVFRFIEKWTGAVPSQLMTTLDQLGNTACQVNLPGGSEADRAYLADVIDQSVWECWQKAEGNHVKEAQAVRDAGRLRLDWRAAIDARRKDRVDQERYEKLLRQAGVLEDQDRTELWESQQWWPNPTDLISWLKKDVFDEDIVERFQLDTDFDAKYTEETEKLAKGIGMSREDLLRTWRAHWQNTSLTTMLDGYHRLRPGKVDEKLVVTLDDLKAAMKQNDIQPYWIDRIIALADTKPTRVDVRRMWELHLLEEDQLKSKIRDLGYSEADSDMMVEYWKKDRKKKELAAVGLPTTRAVVSAYARGELTRNQVYDYAFEVSYYDEQPDQILDAADMARDMRRKSNAIAGVKRRYTTGLISYQEAVSELQSVEIETSQIDDLLRWWDQIKKTRGKELSATQLCQFFTDNIIGIGQFTQALLRIGYSPTDAQMITTDCQYKKALAAQKALEKAQQQAQAAATKAAKSEAANQKAQTRRGRVNAPSQPTGSGAGAAGP